MVPVWPKCSTPCDTVLTQRRPIQARQAWRGVTVDDGDNQAVARQIGEQRFDMAARRRVAAGAGALRRSPARVQPIRRCDGQNAHIAAMLPDDPGSDGLGGDCSLIGDHHIAVGAGLAQQ